MSEYYGQYEPWHEISNSVVCATSKGSDQPAHMCSLIRAFACRLIFYDCYLLTEQHLKFLSLKGGCTGLFESNHVKMPHGWISRIVAQLYFTFLYLWQPFLALVFMFCVHSCIMSRDTWFPIMWYFDKCRLIQACAASF